MAVSKKIKNANIYLVIAGVMMLILFITSSQTFEQQDQTSNLMKLLKQQPFLETFSGVKFMYGGTEVSVAASGYFGFVQFFIRKAAHFMAFFILGGTVFLGLQPRLKNLVLTAGVSWLTATGYAALDEYHQLLTGGRTPLFEDVILDSVGATTAIGICLVIIIVNKQRKKRS